jgi:AcrR family transcriptional regulator
VASDGARQRSVAAARALLRDGGELTMEVVAKRAGITRQTLYNLFGSKAVLVEAVFDELAVSGGMEGMAAALRQSDAGARLEGMVGTMARFWGADRVTMRRIRAMAATDEDLRAAIAARDERRRMACGRVISGFGMVEHGLMVDVLFALTSFEVFDMLAGEERSPQEVGDVLLGLARAALVAGIGN